MSIMCGKQSKQSSANNAEQQITNRKVFLRYRSYLQQYSDINSINLLISRNDYSTCVLNQHGLNDGSATKLYGLSNELREKKNAHLTSLKVHL